MASVSGTEGYAKEAEHLVKQYENVTFADAHASVLHLVPTVPCRVLDVGAGTGRDAAGFAALGHRVVAVEPTDELRKRAALLHPSPQIEWLDDGLPDLARLMGRGEQFEIVMLSAVWMHLDERQRCRAMPNIASLVRANGVVIMSLRHGPVPPGRRMFAVSAGETVRLARKEGLELTLNRYAPVGALKRPGISWTHLVFTAPTAVS